MAKTPMMSGKDRRRELGAYVKSNWQLYVMLLIPVAFVLIFKYAAYPGLRIAFMNYKPAKGYAGSAWVGMENFQKIFKDKDFLRALKNSLAFNFLDLILGFPVPIILALLLNELRFLRFKKVSQTVLYLPHFLSWVIISSISLRLFATNDGMINKLMGTSIPFLGTENNWRAMYIVLGIWKECGWNTIIYLAALTGISPELYEAAEVDGASRLQKIWHITLPGIRSTIIVLLIMNLGHILGSEFDRPFTLSNPLVVGASKTISIFVYERGIQGSQFSLSTAVGLFQSVVCVIFLLLSNSLAKKFGERGIW